jgi:hypothetical protein
MSVSFAIHAVAGSGYWLFAAQATNRAVGAVLLFSIRSAV